MTTKATVVDLNENLGAWFRVDGYPTGYSKCIGERLSKELSLRKVLRKLITERDDDGNFVYDEDDYVILKDSELELIKNGDLQEFHNKTNLDYGYVYVLEDEEVRLLNS